MHEAAAVAGGHCWVERQIFEILGSWVSAVPEVDVKVVIDRHSAHAAWRAQQWEDRLPVLAGLSRPTLVVPPDAGWRRLVDAAGDTDGTVARLAAVYRVLLPRLLGAYRAHHVITSEWADGPSRRTLTIAVPDVTADWAEGETLLQRHLGDANAIAYAADRVSTLEALLVAA